MPKHKQNTPLKLTSKKIDRLKQEAKTLKKEKNISHAEALDIIARENHSSSWKDIQNEAKKEAQRSPPTPIPSLNFLKSENISLSNEDRINFLNERCGELQDNIKIQVAENRALLARKGIEYSVFEPTLTGLKKSILDATRTVRTHFELVEFHDYENQLQGIDYKVIKKAFFVDSGHTVKTKISLYRPNTKMGDPRMWVSKLGDFAQAGDQIAIVVLLDQAFLLNLTKYDLNKSLLNSDSIGIFISQCYESSNEISQELLNKLRKIAEQPLPSIGYGDTSIGMSIEAALGIPANSSKKPDYKGIEIKSGRGGKNRTTIFAQVANWKFSACKSSAEILDKYGYTRGDDFKLYCTISSQKHNSQGLIFNYDSSTDFLNELHSNGDLVATWEGDLLRGRLKEKHGETFWIDARSEIVDGQEVFHLHSVIHTKKPLLNQLMPLIESGVITMDHLIKRKGGKVSEKGPLFKIDKRNLELLFPTPIKYSLIGG